MTLTGVPVSYTHLDVYKRQLLESARAELEDEFPGPEDAVLALPADVTDDEQRAELIDWANDQGGLHILINNAGGNLTRPALEYGEDQWRTIFETNLFSAFELCRLAHPLLSKHAASSIVNVGSVSGITHVRSGAPYGMSKAALHQMTRNLAVESVSYTHLDVYKRQALHWPWHKPVPTLLPLASSRPMTPVKKYVR